MTMLGPKMLDPIKDNEFDVVVWFFHNEVNQAGCSGYKKKWNELIELANQVKQNVPLTAAEAWVRDVSVVAASYLTAWEGVFNSSKMHRIQRAYVIQDQQSA